MEIYKKPLPMACPKKNQQKILAKGNQLVEKKEGPQD